ncbi:MAG TPA: enoyl-CoA hydratase-related protein [Symbiobacteriaceae bacterium]|nr:enoyl-CoA hydratase-related protein [Symbiobacteriaceae bacterium]
MAATTVTTAVPLLLDVSEGIATITINRPWVRNCFTVEMWRTLHQMADQVRDNPQIRVLILQGAGDEAFTSGSDIKELAAMSMDQVNNNFETLENAITAIQELPIPTIASLNGYALGGGLELALACDVRIASERATMGMPIARLGIMISPQFAKRLVDLIGPSRAKDMLYTGRLVGANEAFNMGMVNYFVLSHDLKRTTRDIARRIAGHSANSVRAAKHAVGLCVPLSEASIAEGPIFIDPNDFPEGVSAFLEKRTPNFK